MILPVVDGGREGLTLAAQRHVGAKCDPLQLAGHSHHRRNWENISKSNKTKYFRLRLSYDVSSELRERADKDPNKKDED